MSKIIHNLEVPIDSDLEEKLALIMPNYGEYRVLKKSVDARRRHSVHFVYSVEVAEGTEKLEAPQFPVEKIRAPKMDPVIIVGSGPAGLFAAVRLVERGIPCLLLERGSQAETRIQKINRFWRYGELDLESNVCFGEGGAGLYSDGKLITRIKSPHIPYVLHRLVQFGAPAEIQYLSNPHVGSDKIRRVIPRIREYLQSNGCELHFNTKVAKILIEGSSVSGVETANGLTFRGQHIILATGHSADDVIHHLYEIGVRLEGKSFAMGLRIEHQQRDINKIQYREFYEHPKLGAANYKLAHHDPNSNVGVYSFCMCPGGFVLSSGTEPDGLVCNGMSNFNRGSRFANAAIVVSVDHEKHFGKDLFGGMKLRRQLEIGAFDAVRIGGGTKQLPAQKVQDFLLGKNSLELLPGSSPSGAVGARLDRLLPQFISSKIKEGLEVFEKSMRGFISEQAQLYGVESRTSCPIRVTRDEESLQSVTHQGLYPCGEGAGYAGGITSAACDGIRVAEAIVSSLSSIKTVSE